MSFLLKRIIGVVVILLTFCTQGCTIQGLTDNNMEGGKIVDKFGNGPYREVGSGKKGTINPCIYYAFPGCFSGYAPNNKESEAENTVYCNGLNRLINAFSKETYGEYFPVCYVKYDTVNEKRDATFFKALAESIALKTRGIQTSYSDSHFTIEILAYSFSGITALEILEYLKEAYAKEKSVKEPSVRVTLVSTPIRGWSMLDAVVQDKNKEGNEYKYHEWVDPKFVPGLIGGNVEECAERLETLKKNDFYIEDKNICNLVTFKEKFDLAFYTTHIDKVNEHKNKKYCLNILEKKSLLPKNVFIDGSTFLELLDGFDVYSKENAEAFLKCINIEYSESLHSYLKRYKQGMATASLLRNHPFYVESKNMFPEGYFDGCTTRLEQEIGTPIKAQYVIGTHFDVQGRGDDPKEEARVCIKMAEHIFEKEEKLQEFLNWLKTKNPGEIEKIVTTGKSNK